MNPALSDLRLRPMQCVPDGWIIWCKGSRAVGVSKPGIRGARPLETDTACLSVSDYRRITDEIAAEEER